MNSIILEVNYLNIHVKANGDQGLKVNLSMPCHFCNLVLKEPVACRLPPAACRLYPAIRTKSPIDRNNNSCYKL